jgi:hypothetical protein
MVRKTKTPKARVFNCRRRDSPNLGGRPKGVVYGDFGGGMANCMAAWELSDANQALALSPSLVRWEMDNIDTDRESESVADLTMRSLKTLFC